MYKAIKFIITLPFNILYIIFSQLIWLIFVLVVMPIMMVYFFFKNNSLYNWWVDVSNEYNHFMWQAFGKLYIENYKED